MGQSLVPSLSSRNEFLAKAIENYNEAYIEVFCSYPILYGHLLLPGF